MVKAYSYWFTAYAGYVLEFDSPILESLEAYWEYITEFVGSDDPKHYQSDSVQVLVLLAHNGMGLRHIQHPTPEMCWVAVKHIGHAIRCVYRPTPELYLRAVLTTPLALNDIPWGHRSYEICLTAVQRDGSVLCAVPKHILKTYPEVSMAAVTNCGMALQHVPEKRRTRDLVRIALMNDPSVIQHVTGPTPELYVMAALSNLALAGRRAHSTPHSDHWDDIMTSLTAAVQRLQQ
jgi:hypothetical protein